MLNRCSISVRLLKFVLQARVCTHGMLTEDSPQWIAVLHPFFHWFHHFTYHNLHQFTSFERVWNWYGYNPNWKFNKKNMIKYAGFLSQGSTPIIHFCLGFSIINQPFWGTPLMETPICSSPASADQANIGMAKFQTAPATSPKRR